MVSTVKSFKDFEEKLAAAGDKLIVLVFYVTWCRHCKDMDPHLRTLAKLFKDQVKIVKINAEKFENISDFYNVRNMPTFVFLKHRRHVLSFAGANPTLLTHKIASLYK